MSVNIPQLILEYTAGAAIVSMVNAKLIKPRLPRVGAVISTICAFNPADLAKVLEDVQSLFPGGAATLAAKRLKANTQLQKVNPNS